METNVYKYILRHSLRQQITLTIIAMASFPFLYAFLELPKMIINQAIQGKNVDFPIEFLGFEFEQVSYLFLLSGVFLALVGLNQCFKYAVNVYRGRVGERMLRRLRYGLYSRVLRFPLPQFRKTSQGEIIQMITAEVEPIGGFIGDAFSLPVYQGGILLVTLSFLLMQNWIMALAAIALYPIQFYFIPKLQRRVNAFGKERVRLVRGLSERIGESISGVEEVHAHDTSAFELAQFSGWLGAIYDVRLKIYIWKFIIKFLNNTINQLGPFCFYVIGGYLVIQGELELGTLVAAISAHKGLGAPWKELLNYYQRQADARIKFEQVVEQFEPAGMMDEELQSADPGPDHSLLGDVAGANVGLEDDTGTILVDGATFGFSGTEHVAIAGTSGSGKDDLARLLARLTNPSSGNISMAGARLSGLPESVTGRRIGYVGSGTHMFATSVRDNLLYGLKHRPMVAADYDEEEANTRLGSAQEAEISGNSVDDPNANWIDYQAAGVEGDVELTQRAVDVLRVVDMESDIYDMGLRGTIDPASRENLTIRVLEARAALRDRLADPDIAALVETFDTDRYNDNATLGENLLFGAPVGNAFDIDHLADNDYVLSVLDQAKLTDDLLDAAQQVASLMVELFADLPPGHEFFEQYSFISSDELPEFQALLTRIARDGMESLRPEDRTQLLSLPFKVSPARHRLGVITDDIKSGVLQARRMFAEGLPAELAASIEFFDADKYISAASLQDNILFGKLAYGQAQGADRVGALIADVIDSLGLRAEVLEAGLDFQVGIGGSRLSGSQRQKMAIARAIIKQPEFLILNEATAGLDAASQVSVMEAIFKEFEGRGIIWAIERASMARRFDYIVVMRGGKVVEQGKIADLDVEGRVLRELMDAE
jgi:putative ABC transport system ATP-binding protein